MSIVYRILKTKYNEDSEKLSITIKVESVP